MAITNQQNDLVVRNLAVSGDLIVGDDMTVDGDLVAASLTAPVTGDIVGDLTGDVTSAGAFACEAATDKVGFFTVASAPVVQQNVPLTTPSVQNVIDALVALGLVEQSDA